MASSFDWLRAFVAANGRHIVGHNGGGPGISANFDMLVDSGYTAVILGNYDPAALMPVVMKVRDLIAPAPPSTGSVRFVHE